MATLTPELKEAYSDAVQVLFGGVVQSTPADITQTVVKYVDTMLKEITKCSAAISGLLSDMAGVVYDIGVKDVVGSIIDKIRTVYNTTIIAGAVNTALKSALKEIVDALTSNKQFIGCLNTARANWRSVITMELMGI